jgi:hypothetical protein
MKERFISEAIEPLPEDFDFSQSAAGEPAIPRRFQWRSETLELVEVTRRGKSTSPCTHGSSERYVRRHWYDIITGDGRRLRIYFDRQAGSSRRRKRRWWIYSQFEADGASPEPQHASPGAEGANGPGAP